MASMKSWLTEIERATTQEELVANARDFCSLVHPRDLEPLPQELREIRIEAAEDIARLQEKLEACAAHSRARDAQKLGDLYAFISKAAQRLGEIAPPH